MSVVPFTSASPAAPHATVAKPRLAAASPTAPPRPSAPATGRAHPSSRGDAHAAAASGADRAPFASVLAAARGEEEPSSPAVSAAASESGRIGNEDAPFTASDADDDVADTAGGAPPPTVVAPEESRPPATAATSWLLLALEHAPLARSPEDARPGASPAPGSEGGVTTFEPTGPGALTPVVIDVTAASDPAPASPFMAVPAEAMHAVDAMADLGETVAGPLAARLPVAAVSSSAFDVERLPVDRDAAPSVVVTEIAAAPVDTQTAGSEPGGIPTLPTLATPAEAPTRGAVTADALARWRAATRSAGGDVVLRAPSPPDSGLAAAASLPTPPAEGLGLAAMPAASRATDVLQRLAQSAGESGSRAGGDAATPGTLLAQLLAPASSPPRAIEAPAVAAAAPTLPPAVGEQVAAQIVSSVKMQWKDGIGEARLHLRPDALGQVTVSLRVEHGAVTAVVRADSAQVQEWVLQHQQTLRLQIEAAGLQLDELTVNPEDRGQREREPDGEASSQPRRRSRRTPDHSETPRFELVV